MPRTAQPPRIRVGISGWRYDGWRGDFYPVGLPQRAEMEYACSRFPTVEVNGTFYSLQRAAYFARWRDATAEDFVFAIKGGRFITHMKQLNEPRQALANFFAQGVLALGGKLGPILWQFSQRFRFRLDRFAAFLQLLPRHHDAAARLAREHDHRVRDPATEACADLPVRHAVEIRNESFLVPAFADLLREHQVALVVSDNPAVYPMVEEVTADFMYLRLHGAERMYQGSYGDPALARWADRITTWHHGAQPADALRITRSQHAHRRRRDVFVYFDNDVKARAPFDARRLMERLDLARPFPEPGSADRDPL